MKYRRAIMPVVIVSLFCGRLEQVTSAQQSHAPPVPQAQSAPHEPRPITAGEDIGQPPQQVALQRVGAQMQAVQQRIGQRDMSPATRQVQDQIVGDLDSIIDRLTQQIQAAASARQPAEQESTAGPGDSDSRTAASDSRSDTQSDPAPDKPVDMAAMQSVMQRLWGHLPPRAREQMMQNSVERFLPKYEVEIERYFQRLAEESTDE
ncbi:MAG: hypothetical protein WDZ59_02665 [Pirellulales bacterium]